MWRLINWCTTVVASLLQASLMDQRVAPGVATSAGSSLVQVKAAPGVATSAGPPLVQVTGHPCDQLAGTHDTWLSGAVAVDVVVVGGGVAGLTTLKTLLDHGVQDVILLEAQDYLGGRVRTVRQDGVLVEEGAEWIHGGEDNPLYRLASALHAVSPVLPDNAWDWRVVTEAGTPGDQQAYHLAKKLVDLSEEDGVLTPYYNASLGHFFIDKFNKTFRSQSTKRGLKMKKASLHYLEQIVNLVFGTSDWLQVATRDADRFQEYGDDYQWRRGYDTLVTHLMAKVPDSRVRLSSPVCKIVWEEVQGDRVLVVTLGGDSFLARHVVVTTSVAHLQERHAHLFNPPLPPSFLTALMGVRLAVANKVQMGWPAPWWGSKPLDLHILWTTFDLPHNMSWLYGVAGIFSVHQQAAVVQLFVIGESSRAMEALPEATVKDHLLHLLRRVVKDSIPQPTFFRRTRWGSNPWTRGSYSTFITVDGEKAGLHHHDQLATPLLNSRGKTVVCWAGEHTHNTRCSTVDGAMESGEREALRIITLLKSSPSSVVSQPPGQS